MKRLVLSVVMLLVVAPLVAADEGEGLSTFERARREAEVQRQRIVAKVREQLSGVEPMLAANRFADANMRLSTARRLVVTGDYLSQQEQATWLAEVDRLTGAYETSEAEYLRVRQEQAAKETADRQRERRAAEALFAERRVESHWARISQFRERQEYDKAVDEARALLRVKPNDGAARRAAQEMEFMSQLAEQITNRVARHGEMALALADAEASAIPYNELYRYPDPKAWQEMSQRRLSRLARQLGYTEDSAVSEARLLKRIDLKVTDVSLSNVFTYLSEASGVPILTDPHIEADTGTSPDNEMVTLNATGLTLEQIMRMILPEGTGWRVEEDHIVVSSREKANPLKVITYPIQHMVAEIPDFGKTAPRLSMADLLGQGGQDGGGGGGGVTDWMTGDDTTDTDTTPPQDRIKNMIIRFVKSTDPRVAAWEDEGGPATIEYFNGTLIISQTEVGHRKVAALLARL